MKWFKHISDSLDDPFIYELMDEFGDFGYLAFFGILEIYSREFKPEKEWKLSTTLSFLRSKLHQSSSKRVKNFLQSDLVLKKWNVELDDKRVTIFIPKFTEFIDEWTQRKIKEKGRKLGSKSGVTPKILRHDKEEEVDKEEDRDIINNISTDIFEFSSQAIKSISDHMGSLAPKPTKTLIKNSAETIDMLIRIDGFSLEYIKQVLEWAMNDDFWKKNALSLSSLRKKGKNNLTKFQNMANSFERSKVAVLPERIKKNLQAGEAFVRKMEKEYANGKI